MLNRRQLIGASAAGAALVSSQAWGKTTNMGLPEAAQMDSASTLITPRPNSGPDYTPVVTLNGWTLPHRMNGNVKEFHLVAEPVERELADGMIAHLWGYNGQSTGPTAQKGWLPSGLIGFRNWLLASRGGFYCFCQESTLRDRSRLATNCY